MRIQLPIACLSLGLAAGCITHGLGTKPVPRDPLVVIDAFTRQPVEECLIVPMYFKNSGVGSDEDAFDRNVGYFLAHPFLYTRGQPFRPVQRGGFGVGFPGVIAAASGWDIDRVLVIARGYRALAMSGLWERDVVELEHLDANRGTAEFQRLRRILAQRVISGADGMVFSMALDDNEAILVKFDESERRLLEDFFRPRGMPESP